MDLNFTPNPPGTDNPAINYLPFRDLADLERKIEKLNSIKKLNANLIKATLELYKINHHTLEDGTIIIEPNAIPEVCLEEVTQRLQAMGNNLKQCYEDLGIVVTSYQGQGEAGALYESLINLLSKRKN